MEEFPEERYYGMNRVLLSTVGLWPDDHYKVRHFRFILLLLIVISLPSSQWIKLFTSEYNSDLLLKILSFNILLMLCPIKYITFYAVFKNIKEFRQRVQNNWGALKDNREIEIICKQGSYGKFFTIFIAIINALHAFGLFKIASYRMKHLLSGITPHMCLTKKYIISHNKIIAAVDFHRRAIEFSDLLKVSFGRVYLILYVLGVLSASINLLNLSRIVTMEKDIIEIIKSFFLIASHILYLTVANYAGQEFINNDMHFYRVICNTEWYNVPVKTQKLILFMLQKTTKCYKVDAGGMFNPCLEGLATSLSMSVSYFMVFYSVSL
ncbi:uncharacterized protein LOC120359096 isoform X2 [Solenopsis invicta]|uniref:uncharacterized protein LOC120359096 isoform X2 n=1 Tax=Solenopsis invicta TaxID=13686 RepID=UPI00193DCCD2|nr:uncharacterized protein LOC120359096 isoform X2 [Solenopsis invicta]